MELEFGNSPTGGIDRLLRAGLALVVGGWALLAGQQLVAGVGLLAGVALDSTP